MANLPADEESELVRMEAFYMGRHVPCGWGRDRRGEYHAQFARDAWAAWQEARRTLDVADDVPRCNKHGTNWQDGCSGCREAERLTETPPDTRRDEP